MREERQVAEKIGSLAYIISEIAKNLFSSRFLTCIALRQLLLDKSLADFGTDVIQDCDRNGDQPYGDARRCVLELADPLD